MSTTVNCPQCSAPLELPDVIPAGKRLQCPDCGTAFAPPGEADAELAMTTAPGRPGAKSAPQPAPQRPRRERGRDEEDGRHDRDARGRQTFSSVGVLIVIGVLLLLLLGGVGIVLTALMASRVDREVMVAQAPVQAPMAAQGGMGAGGMAGGPPVQQLKLGDPAPEIVGEDLDGKPMTLADFKGKVVCLVFWGDCCPFKADYNYFNHLSNRMKDQPFVLLGVNCDRTKDEAKLVVGNQKIGWRSWHDGGGVMLNGPIFQGYAVSMVPTTFVIDQKGVIRKWLVGQQLEIFMDQAVNEVMAMGKNRPANAPPLWLPGSTAYGQLAEEVEVGRYRMQPPQGFVLEKSDAGRPTYRWKGPPRQGGIVPVLEVTLTPEPPPPDRKLEDILEKDLEAIPCPMPRLGWTCSGAERGEVNGLTFVRATWGVTQGAARRTNGYNYAAADGDTLIRISWQDSAPVMTTTPQSAAPLTFRKAPAK
jgi:peroxiredoxin